MPFLIQLLSVLPLVVAAQPQDLEDRVREIAAELRCPVCQNLSAADSPAELAQQMRAVILQQLKEGKSPDQVKAYFVSKYGEWVLLAPSAKGFGLLVWILPFVAVIAGMILVFFVVRRWVQKKAGFQPSAIDPALLARINLAVAGERDLQVDLESENPRSLLLQQQGALYSAIRELDFDYQAGKLSEKDYQELRQELATQAATALTQLESVLPVGGEAGEKSSTVKPAATKQIAAQTDKFSRRGWRYAAGGALLLIFGIVLGVLLTQSLRPRGSEQDSITGDFLTGTGPGGIGGSSGTAGMEMKAPSPNDLPALLSQGRAAFERQEWPKAIEAFKQVLAVDQNQPEAHTYMGLILAQAGHADGALMAFDRALSVNPKLPLALWGKGMLLYRAKNDFAGAREILENLLTVIPPGNEKSVIEKTLSEIAELSSRQQGVPQKAKTALPSGQIQRIRGTISLDAKLRSQLDSQSVLFIIAQSANATAGPPLAVMKIAHPVFPLSYSLGPENVMMPGAAFTGRVVVSARLDKDGNPMTKEPGNLGGAYKKNPVAIGSQTVDIVIDRVM